MFIKYQNFSSKAEANMSAKLFEKKGSYAFGQLLSLRLVIYRNSVIYNVWNILPELKCFWRFRQKKSPWLKKRLMCKIQIQSSIDSSSKSKTLCATSWNYQLIILNLILNIVLWWFSPVTDVWPTQHATYLSIKVFFTKHGFPVIHDHPIHLI